MKSRITSRIAMTAVIALTPLSLLGWTHGTRTQQDTTQHMQSLVRNTAFNPTAERVLVVGGSSAQGYYDPGMNSYIRRAFNLYSGASQTTYDVLNHAFYGGEAVKVSPATYASWLAQDRPQVTVISWGMLNDMHARTPLYAFDMAIRNEIEQSLASRSAVLMVTPPPVEASSNPRHLFAFQRYIDAEQNVAASFHNPNVYWFNLNTDMLDYMQAHHISVASLCANSWHPNQAGHTLGGQIFEEELAQTFGDKPIPTVATGTTSIIAKRRHHTIQSA